jgi:hypothetical protein
MKKVWWVVIVLSILVLLGIIYLYKLLVVVSPGSCPEEFVSLGMPHDKGMIMNAEQAYQALADFSEAEGTDITDIKYKEAKVDNRIERVHVLNNVLAINESGTVFRRLGCM